MSTYQQSTKDYSALDKSIRIAFVTGEFNREYTKALEDVNAELLRKEGFENIDGYLVPGAFELPGFIAKLLEKETYDLIFAFGVVIRGATPHFDYVCNECSRGIMDLTMAYDTPIIFGVLTCNTEEQVRERILPNYAISGLNLLGEIAEIGK